MAGRTKARFIRLTCISTGEALGSLQAKGLRGPGIYLERSTDGKTLRMLRWR